MRIRSRFLLLFAAQALVAAAASAVFAFAAFGSGLRRAETEMAGPTASGTRLERVRDSTLPEAERLEAALGEIATLRAERAAGPVYRDQAAIEAAARVGLFALAEALAAALVFAAASRPFTRRLDQLAAGATRAALDRSFRFPPTADREFAPAFTAFDAMLDTIDDQEARLAEAARLQGWKEVSSFLFHQLKGPLATVDMAARNVALASSRGSAGGMDPGAALALAGESSAAALRECAAMQALLGRFRSMAGLSLGALLPIAPRDLLASCVERLGPGSPPVDFSGAENAVLGDRAMVEEAFLNLIRNAFEAGAGRATRVFVRATARERELSLAFSDDNGRVDPAIFERLGRERFSTKREGTGLGLLFVQRVAALHGGSFLTGPSADGGFEAVLSLPLARKEGNN